MQTVLCVLYVCVQLYIVQTYTYFDPHPPQLMNTEIYDDFSDYLTTALNNILIKIKPQSVGLVNNMQLYAFCFHIFDEWYRLNQWHTLEEAAISG